MSSTILHQDTGNGNPEPDPATYTEIAQVTWRGPLTISEQDNPHRLVTHPSGWQFHIEAGYVFARSPAGRVYLLDGVPARTILETLTPTVVTCADCGTDIQLNLDTPHIPGAGYVCFDCLTYYVGRPIFLADPVIQQVEPDHAKS